MAETVSTNFRVLIETNKKLEQIAGETFIRSKGNVVDWAVDELFKKLHPTEEAADETVSVVRVSGEALQNEP